MEMENVGCWVNGGRKKAGEVSVIDVQLQRFAPSPSWRSRGAEQWEEEACQPGVVSACPYLSAWICLYVGSCC